MTNIVSIKPIGKHQTYDLEVNHPDHQFYLSNGVLTSNSHSISYSLTGYYTAWLKAHYPLEFLVANLMHKVTSSSKKAQADIPKIKEEIRSRKVMIVPPDINKSDRCYTIIDQNTLMTGFDALKYMGKDAIPELLAKRPFTSFEDLLMRVDGRKVRAPAIQALAASGCLDVFGLPRKLMYLYASDFRKKLTVFKKRLEKNPKKAGEFKYPWPTQPDWTPAEKHALEIFYIGEGLSGNKVAAYSGFFTYGAPAFKNFQKIHPQPPASMSEKDVRKYVKRVSRVQGEVKDMFVFKVKKEDSKLLGQEMAKIMLEDPHGNRMTMTCFPDSWVALQNKISDLTKGDGKLEVGCGLHVNVDLNWYDGEISMIFQALDNFTQPPMMPLDLEAKQISLRAAKDEKEAEKENPPPPADDRTALLDEVEDEMTEMGMGEFEEEDIDE